MKKTREDKRDPARKLELQRETLRRLEAVELQDARVAGAGSSVVRPTTDPFG